MGVNRTGCAPKRTVPVSDDDAAFRFEREPLLNPKAGGSGSVEFLPEARRSPKVELYPAEQHHADEGQRYLLHSSDTLRADSGPIILHRTQPPSIPRRGTHCRAKRLSRAAFPPLRPKLRTLRIACAAPQAKAARRIICACKARRAPERSSANVPSGAA